MFYSKSTHGFYSEKIHGANMPGDVVEVEDSQYAALLEAQSSGMRIVSGDDGFPTLADPLPPSIPRIVPMRNAQLALHRAGELLAIEALIAAMPGPAGVEARIDWAKASSVDRDSVLVQSLISARGWSSQKVDSLFEAAAAIQ